MNLDFDLANVALTEFGVGRDDGTGQSFVAVPVDGAVQSALREMAETTWDAMREVAEDPEQYDPSEKHGGIEYLYLPLNDEMAAAIRELHEAVNLAIGADALTEGSSDVFCYFARLTDNQNRRLTALRRASQFKGVLKSKNRLVRMLDDTLKIIEDTVFKLDNDFDLLVDSAHVLILRPSGFEFAGKLQQAILAAVPQNVAAIQEELDFVVFDSIEEYAGKHPRAARYLASIIANAETKDIDRASLKKLCEHTGVAVTELNDKVTIEEGHEMGFLEVLDRRRYEISLVKEAPERYRAASRRKI